MSHQDPYHVKPAEEYDEYGNPIRRQTDEYGIPIEHGRTGGEYGTTGAPYGGGDQYQPPSQGLGREHGITGGLRRSDSSSSSEDDGQGGRRKKGMKEKIMEKLPGGQGRRDDQTHSSATTTPGSGIGTGTGGYVDSSGQYHEKKGMMEKIKEKIPGAHNN